MTTLAELTRRVAAIRNKVTLASDPKQWTLDLVDGEEIPAHIRARIHAHDHVCIRYITAGYMPGGPCIGSMQALTGDGPIEILYTRDG